MKRAVITGGTGVVGRALLALLLERGTEVLFLYHGDSARATDLPQSPLLRAVPCSLEELSAVQPSDADSYDAFFHLAWAGSYGSSREDSTLQEKNVQYAADAAALAARLGCRVFVGVGSQSEYGDVPMDQAASPAMTCHPKTAYGAAKLAARERTLAVCNKEKLCHVWARLFSIYGAYDRPQTLVMQAISAFAAGRDGAFTKGEQTWDYLHAADAARALLLLAGRGRHSGIYNVASGDPLSLAEYITQIRDAVNPGCALQLGAVPYYPGQVMNLRADISDLVRDTGFAPEVGFAEGIRRTLAWYRAQKGTK